MSLLVERPPGHELRSDGLYRFIRRLSYLAMITITPSTAAALGSLLALVLAFYHFTLILWRTI